MNDELTLQALWFIAGLGLIILTGDGFVRSASRIAQMSGIPALYIGTFLVGFCTSVPEIVVTYIAANQGAIDLSIGNVLGSYICNIGIVIGTTAIIKPLKVNSETLEHAIPLLAIAIIITALLLVIGNTFSAIDGVVLLGLFFGYILLCYLHIRKHRKRFTTQQQSQRQNGTYTTYILFFLCLGGLLVGSEIMVNAARQIAILFSVDELIIGLTVVAIGTSLPELTACIVAAFREEDDIAMGNIIGSNIFCLLCVLSIPLLMAPPGSISPEKLWVPMVMMLLVTTALWLFSAKFDKICQISRLEGAVLLISTLTYLALTVIS